MPFVHQPTLYIDLSSLVDCLDTPFHDDEDDDENENNNKNYNYNNNNSNNNNNEI